MQQSGRLFSLTFLTPPTNTQTQQMTTKLNWKELLLFLSSIRGDLSNITAPPFILAPSSILEVSSCWAERPSLFSAAAHEASPEKRALYVLKWFLASLRRQLYVGGDGKWSVKKPINAFLGEIDVFGELEGWRGGCEVGC